MSKKSNKIIAIIVLLVVILLSIFVISPIASSTKFHSFTIKELDDKKVTITELSAAAAGTSAALALVPGDATTPMANQILQLSSYLIIVIGAIFLEKVLLTLTGYITFSYLIPISCLLYGIYVFVKKEILKTLAIKLALFGLVIFIVVPVSVQVSNLIEKTYQDSINQTIEDAKNIENEKQENISEENTSEESKENNSGWSEFTSKVKESVSSIGDSASKLVEKGEKMLSNFIDAIAILIITSCVIPIVVLISFMWIIKIVFNANISVPNMKNIQIAEDKKE